MTTLVECTIREFGRLDIAFNNVSAQGDRLPLAEQSEGDVAHIIDVNLNFLFFSTMLLYEGRMESGETVWYIVVDTDDQGNN